MFRAFIYTSSLQTLVFDANFWLCAATLDPEVRIQGQENAYTEVIKTAVGGAAGVIH